MDTFEQYRSTLFKESTATMEPEGSRGRGEGKVGPLDDSSSGSTVPLGLPNGVWTIEGPRGHRTFRISTILAGDSDFSKQHAGKRVLELLVGPENTTDYKGLGWYDANGRVGRLWRFGQINEVLVNTFCKLVERGEKLEGYTVRFARNCYRCNRLLTTPESIARGIGPVCADL